MQSKTARTSRSAARMSVVRGMYAVYGVPYFRESNGAGVRVTTVRARMVTPCVQ